MAFIFPFIGNIRNVIIPTDEIADFSEGWLKTTNQILLFTIMNRY